MVLHSYGMLLPCGIDKFQGTEYVCCPASRTESTQPSLPSQEDDEDEEVEDEEIDEMDLDEEEAVEDRWAIAKVEGRLHLDVFMKYCKQNKRCVGKGGCNWPSGWIKVLWHWSMAAALSLLINRSFQWLTPLHLTDSFPHQRDTSWRAAHTEGGIGRWGWRWGGGGRGGVPLCLWGRGGWQGGWGWEERKQNVWQPGWGQDSTRSERFVMCC